jgi:hypothetical protein
VSAGLRRFQGPEDENHHADRKTLRPTLDLGSHSNAQVQQRGRTHHQLRTVPPRYNAPLSPRLLQPLVRGVTGEGTGIHLLFA